MKHVCDRGYFDVDCSGICDCSGHGACNDGACICDSVYLDVDCSGVWPCVKNQGRCNDGI